MKKPLEHQTLPFLEGIMSSLPSGILALDSHGNITFYNQALIDLLNIQAKPKLNSPFWETFSDDDFGFSLRSYLSSSNKLPSSFLLKRKGGLQARVSPMAKGLSGIIIAVDPLRKQQDERAALENAKMCDLEEMVSVMAHELRNPLGGIKGFASLLQRDLKERPELEKMASYIVKGCENLNNLVTRALDFSRPKDLHFKKGNLNALITDVCSEFKAPALAKKITLATKLPSEQIFASIDSFTLRQSLVNLVQNGIEATPEGGQITVALEAAEHEAIMTISDTGTGILKKNLEKIFLPFFTTRTDGTGLGLAEVRKAVRAHQGSVHVISEEDQGTTFILKIPTSEGEHP